jgi:hypothetical protein
MKRGGILAFLILCLTFFTLTFLGQAAAVGLSVISDDYDWQHRQWVPGSPHESHADAGGEWHASSVANSYSYDAYAYAQGRIYLSYATWLWCCGGDAGCGAYREWYGDIDFQVTGEPGEKADVFLDLMWHGSAWVERSENAVGGYAKAFSNYSLIVSDQGQELLDLQDYWQVYISENWGHVGDTFGSYPEPFYLGQMTVGDTFSISSYLQANANAYLDISGTLQARMDAYLDYIVTAEEIPAAASVPEPATMALLAIGLAGFVGCERRRMKK